MSHRDQHTDGLAEDLRARLAQLKPGERVRAIVMVNLEISDTPSTNPSLNSQSRIDRLKERGNRLRELLPTIERDLNRVGCRVVSRTQPNEKGYVSSAAFLVDVTRSEASQLGRLSWVRPPIMMDQEIRLPGRGRRA